MGQPRKYAYKGAEYTLGDLSRLPECNVDKGLLATRLNLGWSVSRALSEPTRESLKLTAWGETKSLSEWFEDDRCAVDSYDALVSRYKRHGDDERILTQPLERRGVTAWGETKPLTEWMDDPRCTAKNYSTVSQRLGGGMPPEEALTRAINSSKSRDRGTSPACIDGVPITELVKHPDAVVTDYATVWSRGARNMSAMEAITTPTPTPSSGEQSLATLIESRGFEVVRNDRKTISPKELDVLIPDLALAFEYNGVYWHAEKHVGRNYHYDKWQACRNTGIQLIQVWEDDWVFRRPQVERMIEAKLGVLDLPRVSGRSTIVTSISYGDSARFLNQHHIQGAASGSLYLGLNWGCELVAVMVLKRGRGEWRLERYATSALVRGGFSKLFSHFLKEFTPPRVVTFADHCVSDGSLYESQGWIKEAELAPDYRYLIPGKLERVHKFRYRRGRFEKDETLKFDPKLSESELARLNGLERVWDAGKTRYAWVT